MSEEREHLDPALSSRVPSEAEAEAEDARRESEARMRLFIEHAPAALAMFDRQMRYVSVSRRWLSDYGLDGRDVIGRSHYEIFPEIPERWRAFHRRGLSGEVVGMEEDPFERADLSVQWLRWEIRPWRDGAGDVAGIVIFSEDITTRRRAEELLRSSERRLIGVLESMPDAFVSFDADLRYTYVNANAEQMQGARREELLGKKVREVYPDVESAKTISQYERVIAEQRPVTSTSHHGGYGRWVEVRAFPTPDGASVFFKDVSAQVRAEEALRESDEQFRVLIRNLHSAVALIDEHGAFVIVNPSFRRMFEIPEDADILNINSRDWAQWQVFDEHGALLDVDEHPVRKAALTGVGVANQLVAVRSLSTLDLKWVLVSAEPILDAKGALHRVICSYHDITLRRSVEEELRRAKAAAEEASQAKDDFLAVLSHELRTPLAPVVTGLSMLQARPGLDELARETLAMIRRNVELEARLIDDLLDVTRISRGKVELELKPVDLVEIVRRAVEVCRADIDARRLEFGLDVGSGSYTVEADATRLQQVFWNLLRNAVKFTPKGGCIGIRCRGTQDHGVVVEVSDSGEGIEPEALSGIFKAFEQTERSITRQFGGLGLGLTISKALVELHGGGIEARSAGKGKGATFTVVLPLAASRVASGTTPPVARPAGRRLRILLVEDHGDSAEMMRQLLTLEGHDVESAGDVVTALDTAAQGAFDLLISDLGLPDRSGLDLIRELRARGEMMPAIALSGYGQEQDIRRSREAGFAAHLIKPASPERLAETIAAVSTPPGGPGRG
jgi:two-component system, chemotaxis family, CheB/CheR fusion protein